MKVAAIQNLSSFTLLSSPIRVKSLLASAKKKGYAAVGLTDINVTYGLVNFYELAQKVGIHPLLGMQLRSDGLVDQTSKFDLILLAKNNQGYQNLLRLSSAVNLLTNNGQEDKSLPLKRLGKYFRDLIIIVPANQKSELVMLAQNQPKLADNFLRRLVALLSSSANDSLYLGVYARQSQKNYISFVKSLGKQFGLPLVATEDTHYLEPKDQFLQKALLAIKNNTQLHNQLELAQQAGSHFLADAHALRARYHEFGLDEAVTNTWQIAKSCQAKIVFRKPVLPKYQQNKFSSSKAYLKYLAETGLRARFPNHSVPKAYQKRLTYELKIINQMGFDDYFLIVWDVMNYCHKVKITTGPGRGSACGSLVSYALRITEVDPLAYHLLFERFLNPARHEMPDIDLDIPDNRRDHVILYMYHKYGIDHAAQILTFGTMAAKQAIRDIGRVFGLTLPEVNKWAAAIPHSKGKINLTQAYQNSRSLRLLVNATPLNRLLFQTAHALEGLPRHYSIHAAGLVISDHSIAKIAGLQAGPLGIPVTQQTKKYVESLGLLKIDFLGLRNLTILGDTLALIKKGGHHINPNQIPLNDAATLSLFRAGRTTAVFQFESVGIRQVLRSLKPDNFEDLVAVNALYRPGPMQNIPAFIVRKHGQEAITYPAAALKPILASTYGILVYQEQVMQTARVLAGFSLGEADILRRAMSKKQETIIAKERERFIKGAIKQGYPRRTAQLVYRYIAQFANYGFNRSHAVAYTKIAFWLAYLKVHYPAAFYTALMNSAGAGKAKTPTYIMQAQEAGIKILPPDINHSQLGFTLYKGNILVGLHAIKGLRADFAEEIINLKKPVTSLLEFLRQIKPSFLEADTIRTLIMAGCFDKVGHKSDRNRLLANCEDLIENVQLTGQNVSLSASLGGVPLKSAEPTTPAEKAQMEEKTLGFATATSPLIIIQRYAKRFGAKALQDFALNENGVGVGKLLALKPIQTKKGQEMAFGTFTDSHGKEEVVIFPKIYQKIKQLLKVGIIYLLGLRVQADRYNANRKQYLLTHLKMIHFKR